MGHLQPLTRSRHAARYALMTAVERLRVAARLAEDTAGEADLRRALHAARAALRYLDGKS